MTITHSIDDSYLMGFAAGLLPEPFDLLVATAVSLDDEARARLAGFEAMGGALMMESEVAPLRDDTFDAVMGRIMGTPPDDMIHSDIKTPRMDPTFPQPLREVVGGDLDEVRWRSAGMGVKQAILRMGESGSVRLLKIPAGKAMPDHGHKGTEITLVLRGAFHDGADRYGRGDVEVADPDVHHTPVAEAGEDCICLVVTDAPLEFQGLLPKIAQRFLQI
ncbi:MAG: ChrR family anti-sigma-E factor [Pseudomonadota bacterium]